jgi:hypothetical protein
MSRLTGRLAVLLACLTAAVGIGSPAVAAPPIGTLKVWAGGVPSRLGTAGTIDLTMYYSQNSPDTLSPAMFAVGLWNPTAPGDVMATVSASWLNPLTQAWQASTRTTNDWILDMPSQPEVKVPPNTTASARVRLTFAPSARPGTYRLQLMPANAYWLLTPGGVEDSAILDYHWPQYDIVYGTAAAPATPQTARPAPTGKAAKPTTSLLPSVTQSASPAVSVSPSPTAPTAPTASASGSPVAATVELAAHGTRGGSTWPYLGALVAGVLLAAGGYGYRLRRRRVNGPASSEPEQAPGSAGGHPQKAEE